MRQTLRKSEILSGYHSFEQVLQNGVCVRGNFLHCFVLAGHPIEIEKPANRTKHSPLRIGFSVPKKNVPLAVKRNRIKRLLREVFRKNKEQLYNTLNNNRQLLIVVIYRGSETKEKRISYAEIEREWNKLIPQIITAK